MKNIIISLFVTALTLTPARACDSCGTPDIDPLDHARATANEFPFAFAVAEQYTYYHTLQAGGVDVGNPLNQYIRSSFTTFVVAYHFSDRLSVQFNAPWIYRSYRRPNGAAMEEGTVQGWGDVSLLANFVALRQEKEEWGYTVSISGGVKFPTGNTSQLDEESPSAPPPPPGPDSAVGGHDLNLGSGSYDGILGFGVNARWRRAFFTTDLEYTIRSTGYIGYRFANELKWSAGPGYEVLKGVDYTLSLQALGAGEYKQADTVQGIETDDTAITTINVGPRVILSVGRHVSAYAGVELPVVQNNSGLQLMAEYRIKAGVAFRF